MTLHTWNVQHGTSVTRRVCIIILTSQRKHRKFHIMVIFSKARDMAEELGGGFCPCPLTKASASLPQEATLTNGVGWEKWRDYVLQIEKSQHSLLSGISQLCATNEPFLSTHTALLEQTGSAHSTGLPHPVCSLQTFATSKLSDALHMAAVRWVGALITSPGRAGAPVLYPALCFSA